MIELSGKFKVTVDTSYYTKEPWLSSVGEESHVTASLSWPNGCGGGPPVPATTMLLHFERSNFTIATSNRPVTLMNGNSFLEDARLIAQDGEGFCSLLAKDGQALHGVLFAFGARRLPAAKCAMNAYSLRTFRLTGKADDRAYCRFHFRALVNGRPAKDDQLDCDRNSMTGNDFAKEAEELIKSGGQIEFQVAVQTLSEVEAEFLDWNPLDQTKIWLRRSSLLLPFAKLTLNEIVKTNNTYDERVFCEGIEPILDPKSTQIPIGAPRCEVHPDWLEVLTDGDLKYLKSLPKRRLDNHYWQPGLFCYKVLNDEERYRMARRIALFLKAVESKALVNDALKQLKLANPSLERCVKMTMDE